jgi:hypothetical protein
MRARPAGEGESASGESSRAVISRAASGGGSGGAERRENTEKMGCPGPCSGWSWSGEPLPRAIAMPSVLHPHLAMTTEIRQRCGRVRSVTEWLSAGLAIALSNVAPIMQSRSARDKVTDWSIRGYWLIEAPCQRPRERPSRRLVKADFRGPPGEFTMARKISKRAAGPFSARSSAGKDGRIPGNQELCTASTEIRRPAAPSVTR